MKNDKIDILCAITYVYKRKKLAIMCPVGRMQQSMNNFNVENLATMFNAPISITYPCDVIGYSEKMIEPIVKSFGRVPDDAYSMVVDIEESDTEKSLNELREDFDKLYPIEENLKADGYKIYPIFYVINNIEEFKDLNDFERDINNIGEIARIKYEKFDLDRFIKEVRKNYNNKIDEKNIPNLLTYNKESLIENCNIYESIYKDESLSIEFINQYLRESTSNVIEIISGYDNMDGNIVLLNGKSISDEDINSGEMEFYDDTIFMLTIELVDNYYIFKQYMFTTSFSRYEPLDDSGDLTNILLDIILKYKK